MDDILSRGLLPVGKVKDGSESVYSRALTIHPPRDSYNLVYLAMVLSGAGFLLPYNSFITAVDYFQTVFPGTTIVFDISLIYILTALIAVLLNNVIIYTFSLNTRIMFGYILSFLILMSILIFIIRLDVFPADQTYAIILVCVALISVGATGELELTLFYTRKISLEFLKTFYHIMSTLLFTSVQQSSFYGLTGMLPARYTQAVMTGESRIYRDFFVVVNIIFCNQV